MNFLFSFILAVASYRTHGPAKLNDLTFTPGAVSAMTADQLCDPNFHTSSIRNVPQSLKYQVCDEYGIVRADCTGQHYEIDHLVSLELGGTNDIKNLWPQPYAVPGAHEKDVVENYLHRQVCSKTISLETAQEIISADWYTEYLALPHPTLKPSNGQ